MQNRSNKYPILAFIFALVSVGFLYFSFLGFFEGIINRGNTGAGSATGITYMYNRICSLICIIIGGFFYYKGQPRIPAFGKTLVILLFFEIIRACIDPSGDMWINRILTPTIWILLYFGYAGFFMCYDKYIPLNKKVIVVFIIYSFLFLKNLISANIIGVTNWHFIESYYLITLIPFIILLPNKTRISLTVIMFALLLFAGKRTGLVVYMASILTWMLFSGQGLSKKVKTISLFIIIGICSLLLANSLFPEKLDFIISRFTELKEDGGSGRDTIYEVIFKRIFETDGIDFIFGHGYNAVSKSNLNNGLSAHNEFLEMAWDYGILGVILYSILIIQLFIWSRKKMFPETIRIALIVSATIMLFMSLTSHLVLYSTYVLNLVAFWGFATAYITKRRKGNNVTFY